MTRWFQGNCKNEISSCSKKTRQRAFLPNGNASPGHSSQPPHRGRAHKYRTTGMAGTVPRLCAYPPTPPSPLSSRVAPLCLLTAHPPSVVCLPTHPTLPPLYHSLEAGSKTTLRAPVRESQKRRARSNTRQAARSRRAAEGKQTSTELLAWRAHAASDWHPRLAGRARQAARSRRAATPIRP